MRRMTFKQGERIFTKGQSSDFAFLILSGKVEIVLERGKVADVIASLEASEVFGEMGLIDSGPRSASGSWAVANSPSARIRACRTDTSVSASRRRISRNGSVPSGPSAWIR